MNLSSIASYRGKKKIKKNKSIGKTDMGGLFLKKWPAMKGDF